jgi:hypothetical protein
VNLVRPLLRNWGAKLLSLLLAWGLWYAVREDLEDVREATLTVVAEGPEGADLDGVVLTPRVAAKLKGPRREVEVMASGAHALVAPLSAGDLAVDQHTTVREFRSTDLRPPAPMRPGVVRIVEMDPEVVRVQVRRLETRQIPLAPPEFPGAKEAQVVVEIRRRPEEVLVRGPVEQLRSILELRTSVPREQIRRAAESMGDAARTTVTLPLVVDPAQRPFATLLEPRDLEATVDLVRVQEREVTLPLSIYRDEDAIRGAGPRRLQFAEINKPCLASRDPPAIQVRLRGSPRALDAVRAETLRAFVLEHELPIEATFGDLRVHTSDLPPGVTLDRDDYAVSVEIVH